MILTIIDAPEVAHQTRFVRHDDKYLKPDDQQAPIIKTQS